MRALRFIGEHFNNMLDHIAEGKRKSDEINRLDKGIKHEYSSIVKSYIALGKHYYTELRGVPNKEMQRICASIDSSKREIRHLKCKLDEVKHGCDIKFYYDSVDDVDNYDTSCCDKERFGGVDCCGCDPVCDCGDFDRTGTKNKQFDKCDCCGEDDIKSLEQKEGE